MKSQCKMLFEIFWSFFKIAPVTFGGGYAMIPLIEREIVEKKKWLKSEEISEVMALSQSVPGAVGINSASFIGHRILGIKGAVAALIGVSLPTFFIVLLLGLTYFFFQDNPKIEAAFMAIRASIVAIIVYAAIKIGKTAIIDKLTFFFMLIGIPILFFIHPVIVVVLGGVFGMLAVFVKRKLGQTIPFDHIEAQEEDYKNHPDYFMGAGI